MAVPIGGRERASRYLPLGGPAVVDHSGSGLPDHRVPARQFFLQKVRVSEQALNRLFDATTGQFIYRAEKPPQDLYSMEPLQLDQYLRKQLDPIYSIINGSLDESKPNSKGFNKHDTPHIDRVTYGTWALLEQMKQHGMSFTDDDMRDTIIASRLHDLGNLLTRADHSAIGVDIALLAIPYLGARPERLEKIREMIYYHDEPRIRDAIHLYEAQTGVPLTADEAVGFFEREFKSISPGLLAIVMADKTDITRNRFSLKAAQSADPEDCLQDQHLLLNFFFESTPFFQGMNEDLRERTVQFASSREGGYSDDGTEFRWQIRFNPNMVGEEGRFFKNLVRHVEDQRSIPVSRAHIPQDIFSLYREEGVPLLAGIEPRLWRLYWDRIRFTIISAFALNPALQTFSLDLFDPDDPIDPYCTSGIRHSASFVRGNLEKTFHTLEQRYFPKKEERPSRRGGVH